MKIWAKAHAYLHAPLKGPKLDTDSSEAVTCKKKVKKQTQSEEEDEILQDLINEQTP